MKAKYIILYIALLVVPSLLIGGIASRLLRHEDDRLRMLAQTSLTEQAAVMAGHIDLLVHEMTDSLLDSFARLPAHDAEALYRWKEQHPLARHVFVWQADGQLRVPDAQWASPAEVEFMRRYDAFFSGRREWPNAHSTAEEPDAPTTSLYAVQRTRVQEARRAIPAARDMDLAHMTGHQQGWIPWFWERDVHLLGWIQSAADASVRGVEIEQMAVYARFHPLFEDQPHPHVALGLYDHNGERIIQTRDYPTAREAGTPVEIPVSDLLPHWQLRAIDLRDSGSTSSFVFLGGLLMAILLTAILSGGGLLVWQGYRNYRNATQKTSFVANVSHELKTPLTTIRMYAEMLQEGRVRDPDKQTDYLHVIVSESHRLSRLVNNVLDFSRLEQQRKSYRSEAVNLTELVQAVATTQKERLDHDGIELILPQCNADPVVMSDRDALEQVLLNLLDNAGKYAAEGGGVEVDFIEEPHVHILRVSDRGPGIPAAHAARVFDSFHRVDDSLTTRVPGAGLGLSIGRRMLRDLGGDLAYRPREGGGATFEIRIPKEPPHA